MSSFIQAINKKMVKHAWSIKPLKTILQLDVVVDWKDEDKDNAILHQAVKDSVFEFVGKEIGGMINFKTTGVGLKFIQVKLHPGKFYSFDAHDEQVRRWWVSTYLKTIMDHFANHPVLGYNPRIEFLLTTPIDII